MVSQQAPGSSEAERFLQTDQQAQLFVSDPDQIVFLSLVPPLDLQQQIVFTQAVGKNPP